MNKFNELTKILENDEKQITTTSVQWIKNQHPTSTSSMGSQVVLHSSSKANASSEVSTKTSSVKSSSAMASSVENSVDEANTVHADTVSAVKLAQADALNVKETKSEAKKNTLPQMGDENSNKTVWGEISLAMAGVLATLGLADRKRRN